MEPYTGAIIQVANGQPLDIVGVVQIGLAMPGLESLQPTIVEMMICKSLSSDFLMGRRMLNEWNLSIIYYNKTETWQAGKQRVPAITAREARRFNNGLQQARYLNEKQRDGTRASIKINPHRGWHTRYQWADISQGGLDPPLKQTHVQSVQTQKDPVPRPQAPAQTGNPPLSKKPADPPRKPCPTPNIGNGNNVGKSRKLSPTPNSENGQGNKPRDILLKAAADVVLKPRSIRKVQVTYPSVPNPPGKQRHHFLVEATDASGKPVNPDEPVEIGTLSAVIRLHRGQQAMGNKVSVFMVNSIDQYQTVLANTVVGR